MPTDALGVSVDSDLQAINLSVWAFADPARTRGDPVDAARAVASVDYLAGEVSSSPRWLGVSPLTKQQLLDARQEVRAALGIPPAAPSQAVVNTMLYTASAVAAGNPDAALAALNSPLFTLGPQQTLARLDNLPYLHTANIATQHMSGAAMEPSGRGCMFGC
jgi:hypothetical protein